MNTQHLAAFIALPLLFYDYQKSIHSRIFDCLQITDGAFAVFGFISFIQISHFFTGKIRTFIAQ
jgi:hypothetical protein